MAKVEKTYTCWNWIGRCFPSRYGAMVALGETRANRLSYLLHYGSLPKDKLVCHKCDNPKCVNPDHLFLGTQADNIKDKMNKNRGAKGVNMAASKLNEKDIFEIRNLAKTKQQREIAKIYNVNQKTIWSILHRITWKHCV